MVGFYGRKVENLGCLHCKFAYFELLLQKIWAIMEETLKDWRWQNLDFLRPKQVNHRGKWQPSGISYFSYPLRFPTKWENFPEGAEKSLPTWGRGTCLSPSHLAQPLLKPLWQQVKLLSKQTHDNSKSLHGKYISPDFLHRGVHNNRLSKLRETTTFWGVSEFGKRCLPRHTCIGKS